MRLGAWPLVLVLWIIVALLLLFGRFAEGADRAACTRAEFRLRSTGECVAKNSALGREYYRGGRGSRVIPVEPRHPRSRHHRRRAEPEPAPLPSAPDPREDEVWPPPSEFAQPTFGDRFYFESGKGDKQ